MHSIAHLEQLWILANDLQHCLLAVKDACWTTELKALLACDLGDRSLWREIAIQHLTQHHQAPDITIAILGVVAEISPVHGSFRKLRTADRVRCWQKRRPYLEMTARLDG
jgi:hypothetical protein